MTYEEFEKADQTLAESMAAFRVVQANNEEFAEVMSRQIELLIQRHKLCDLFVNQV